jgi:hypothetical protein
METCSYGSPTSVSTPSCYVYPSSVLSYTTLYSSNHAIHLTADSYDIVTVFLVTRSSCWYIKSLSL